MTSTKTKGRARTLLKRKQNQKWEHAELVQKLSEEQEQYQPNNECQEIKHLQLAKFVEATIKSI